MSKEIMPADENGYMLAVGDHVMYDNKEWKVIDHEDTSAKYYDDDYTEHSVLKLQPMSGTGRVSWVKDFEVSGL